MIEFFKFGSKGSGEARVSKPLPKGNAYETRKANDRRGTRGFGELLLQEGAIREYQLEEAFSVRGKSGDFIGQVLVDLGYIERDAMLAALEKYFGIPHMQLVDRSLDRDVVERIPRDICLSYSLIAVGENGRELKVAMVDPLDKRALVRVRRACPNHDIKPVLCTRRLIENLQSAFFEDLVEGVELGEEESEGAGWTRLGELLVEHGVISQKQCEEGLLYQSKHGGFFGQCLVELGILSQDQVTCFLVKQLGIPFINLAGCEIDREILALIPQPMCLDHYLLPVDTLGRTLTVAMVNPLDLEAIEEIEKLHPEFRVQPILCVWEDFKNAVARLFFRREENFDPGALEARLRKPKEAVPSEDAFRDAVCAAVNDLFEATASRYEAVPVRSTHTNGAATAPCLVEEQSGWQACVRVDEYAISKEALATIPKEICLAHRLLPIEKMGRILAVAMVDVQNKAALELVRRLCPDLSVRPIRCSAQQFGVALARAFNQ